MTARATHPLYRATESRGRRVSAVLLLAFVASALAAGGASAAQYSYNGIDMRAFVRNANPAFTCGTGYVGVGAITVTAPTNYGPLDIFVTVHVQRWNGSVWSNYNPPTYTPLVNGTKSRFPYGLPAGQSFAFPGGWMQTASGYYREYIDVDFHQVNQPSFSHVWINAAPISDWAASYRYQGPGYSYCWHG